MYRSLLLLVLTPSLAGCASLTYRTEAEELSTSIKYCWVKSIETPPYVSQCDNRSAKPALEACISSLASRSNGWLSRPEARGDIVECMSKSGWILDHMVTTG